MRIFLAIELPERLREEIAAISADARRTLPPARWSRAPNLHLTLHFFGERSTSQVEAIRAALAAVLADAPPLSLALGPSGSFPPSRPRVVWLAVREAAGGTTALERLHGTVQSALATLGEEADPRPYRPHLTLARCKGRWRRADLARLGELYAPLDGAGFPAGAASLIESTLQPGGAVYRTLAELPLAGASTSDGR